LIALPWGDKFPISLQFEKDKSCRVEGSRAHKDRNGGETQREAVKDLIDRSTDGKKSLKKWDV